MWRALVSSATKQSAATDKLLEPLRGGSNANRNAGSRSAERCLRSLSRQITAIAIKFPEEDMVLIGKSDRLLLHENFHRQPGIKAARIVEGAQGGQFPGETTGHLPRKTRLAQIERRRFLQ